jgi:hypothetical protein
MRVVSELEELEELGEEEEDWGEVLLKNSGISDFIWFW